MNQPTMVHLSQMTDTDLLNLPVIDIKGKALKNTARFQFPFENGWVDLDDVSLDIDILDNMDMFPAGEESYITLGKETEWADLSFSLFKGVQLDKARILVMIGEHPVVLWVAQGVFYAGKV
jgi:hypothetical protein